jgi:Na+/melibiose symporter-like transporter
LTKIIVLFMLALALIQIIKPLGWPGLKKRSDAWKLALAGLMVTVIAVGLIALYQ